MPYVLGLSGGGSVALRLAIDYPNSVSKIVLGSSVARFKELKMPKFFENLRKLKFLPSVRKAEKFYILNEQAKDITKEELKQIKAKVLVINGGKKDVVPISEAEFIHSNLKNSEKCIFEKDSHSSYTRKKYFYDKVIYFLKE
ncbi:MAG: hypothetical protein IJ809_02635 [Clostridia bacterium]|nr:hypothetical protein [Clostridia bacterium]